MIIIVYIVDNVDCEIKKEQSGLKNPARLLVNEKDGNVGEQQLCGYWVYEEIFADELMTII